jgi:polar amino acid transport system substrate-binding protein
MKKLFALILTMAIMLSACGKNPQKDRENKNRLQQIKERGYITVATEPYFAPNEFIDPTKPDGENIVGTDIEFAKYLAEKLGVELKIVPLEFTEVLSSVQNGKYDLAISALSWTSDRRQGMNLSKSYYTSDDFKGYGMVTKKENRQKYSTAQSFKDAVLIVQKGSLQEKFIKEQIPEYKDLKFLAGMCDTFLAVSEGKADAAACSIDMAEVFIRANPDLDLEIVKGFKFDRGENDDIVVGMMKGESELTEEINRIIDEFLKTDLYKRWNAEYKDYAKSLGIK